MGLLFVLGLLALVFLLVPYGLTRLVLHLTLACYRDKTSPQAASGVRVAAAVCFGVGLLTWGSFSYTCWLESVRGWGIALWVLPLACHWAALAIPLRVKVPGPATAEAEPGFSRF